MPINERRRLKDYLCPGSVVGGIILDPGGGVDLTVISKVSGQCDTEEANDAGQRPSFVGAFCLCLLRARPLARVFGSHLLDSPNVVR